MDDLYPYPRPRPKKGKKKLSRRGKGFIGLGLILMVLGGLLAGPKIYAIWSIHNQDQQALKQWQDPGAALTKPLPPGASAQPTAVAASVCGSGSLTNSFALVAFPTLAGVAGVAGNGNWDMLQNRSMVHYSTTPAPGGVGNTVFAFHREPSFEVMDQLKVGDSVFITDRSCKVWTYVVRQEWSEDPSRVTQLNPIATGNWATFITCTPIWQDYERLVIRLQLQS